MNVQTHAHFSFSDNHMLCLIVNLAVIQTSFHVGTHEYSGSGVRLGSTLGVEFTMCLGLGLYKPHFFPLVSNMGTIKRLK
jgi:hypothetical protein